MENFVIKKASKKAKKLRIGLSAPSGFGKTYSSLLLAKGICNGDLSKVCVIDTERGSADLYADLGEYSTVQLLPPYEPERYIQAIKQIQSTGNFEVIIIDSITHEWEGEGGCLEIQTKLGGKYQDWGKVTPRHNAFINAILTSTCHVITTVRRKQDYDMVNVGGRTQVQKVGMKEQTRDGFEYELDVNFEVVTDTHLAKAGKDRTSLFKDTPEFVITEATGKQLVEWASNGKQPIDEALEAVRSSKTLEELTSVYNTYKDIVGQNNDFIDACKAKKTSFSS
ncbi:MAG: AAA family ATPase [Bacteroidales bacterium]